MNTTALAACLRLTRAQAALSRRFSSELGGIHGISFSEFVLLLQLEHAPGGRLRRVDLAELLPLSQSGVTRALAPLERAGLVARAPDPRDARVSYAVLTAVGRERVHQALATASRLAGEVFAGGGWQAGEVDALSDLAERLVGAARARST